MVRLRSRSQRASHGTTAAPYSQSQLPTVPQIFDEYDSLQRQIAAALQQGAPPPPPQLYEDRDFFMMQLSDELLQQECVTRRPAGVGELQSCRRTCTGPLMRHARAPPQRVGVRFVKAGIFVTRRLTSSPPRTRRCVAWPRCW